MKAKEKSDQKTKPDWNHYS